MSKPSWTHPQCEQCWIEHNSYYEPARGVVVRVPHRMIDPDPDKAKVEQCAWCGNETVVGIYVREDPANVQYPAMEDDDAS